MEVILVLEVVVEPKELLDTDPGKEDPALLTDILDPAAAMGAETLLACVDSGNCNAKVTDPGFWDELTPIGGSNGTTEASIPGMV